MQHNGFIAKYRLRNASSCDTLVSIFNFNWLVCRKWASLHFVWDKKKIHSLFSEILIKNNRTNRYLLQGLLVSLGWMSNRGIYGNVGLHKNYLRSKFSTYKKQVSVERLKEAVQPCMEWIPIKRKCYMHLFSHASTACLRSGIQI